MSVLSNELIKSGLSSRVKWIIGPSSMMTSLDMKGFSISVCPITTEELKCLSEPVQLSNWPGCQSVVNPAIVDMPDGLRPNRPVPSNHEPTRKLLTDCCAVLLDSEADLNKLDAFCGDGDTGSTLASAARALTETMDEMPLADHTQMFRALGQELSQTMGGSSGVLLAIFFAAAGDSASSGASIPHALLDGLKRMQEIGGANLGDRSMVDALEPALAALASGQSAASASREGATKTAQMVSARVGRATYLGADQLKGHVDPGAEAVARIFEHLER